MRFVLMALTLACLGAASNANAEARGFVYGPLIAYSIPTQDAADALVPRASYGVTGTFLESPRRGFGVDIAYHRWPASPDADRSLDQLLSFVAGESIVGSRTTVSIVQATLHGKFLAPEWGPVLPWMKVGAGVYRFNSKVALPIAALQAAGVRVVTSDPDNISREFGYQFGAGLDLEIVPDTWLGLDASYHLIVTRGPFFSAFAIGMCLLTRPRRR